MDPRAAGSAPAGVGGARPRLRSLRSSAASRTPSPCSRTGSSSRSSRNSYRCCPGCCTPRCSAADSGGSRPRSRRSLRRTAPRRCTCSGRRPKSPMAGRSTHRRRRSRRRSGRSTGPRCPSKRRCRPAARTRGRCTARPQTGRRRGSPTCRTPTRRPGSNRSRNRSAMGIRPTSCTRAVARRLSLRCWTPSCC